MHSFLRTICAHGPSSTARSGGVMHASAGPPPAETLKRAGRGGCCATLIRKRSVVQVHLGPPTPSRRARSPRRSDRPADRWPDGSGKPSRLHVKHPGRPAAMMSSRHHPSPAGCATVDNGTRRPVGSRSVSCWMVHMKKILLLLAVLGGIAFL